MAADFIHQLKLMHFISVFFNAAAVSVCGFVRLSKGAQPTLRDSQSEYIYFILQEKEPGAENRAVCMPVIFTFSGKFITES